MSEQKTVKLDDGRVATFETETDAKGVQTSRLVKVAPPEPNKKKKSEAEEET